MELGVGFFQVRDGEAQATPGGGQGTVAQKVPDVPQVDVVLHEREPVLADGCCSAHKRLNERIYAQARSFDLLQGIRRVSNNANLFSDRTRS